jgi:hypothetical protein
MDLRDSQNRTVVFAAGDFRKGEETMGELKLNSRGQVYTFREDGTVVTASGDAPAVKGKWRATAPEGGPGDNCIRYDIDGVEQPPVPAKHSFNEYNQLVTTIPAIANDGTDSQPCTWLGRIIIDDGHDLVYQLLTGPTAPAHHEITVYGDLHFDGEVADLVIDLAGGGQAVIKGEKGDKGISQLTIGQSDVPDFDAKDILRFQARTRNDFPDLPARFPNRADIAFTGKWDISPDTGGVVFLTKVAGAPGRPTVALAFGGQFKAVTTGFAYVVNNGGPQIAFNVNGSHQWSAADASFKVTVGYSKQVFLADLTGAIRVSGAAGSQFSLSGNLSIRQEQGQNANFDLTIEGRYEFDSNRRLVFRADVSSVNKELNYDVMLEGNFVYKAGTLSFQIKFSKSGPNPATAIQLAYEGNRADLQTKLALVLNIAQDRVDFGFEFQLRMHFKGGVLVKDKPKPLAA